MLRYPYALLRDLSRGQINLHAMGLVYATLLSLVPLLAFAFAVLKDFGGHRELQPIILEFFKPVGDKAGEFTQKVMEFADGISTGLLGPLALALLLWTLLGTIKKVEDSFNFLWRVEEPRSFARRVTEYVTLLIVGPIVVVSFLGAVAQRAGKRDCGHRPLHAVLRAAGRHRQSSRRTSWSRPFSPPCTCSCPIPG